MHLEHVILTLGWITSVAAEGFVQFDVERQTPLYSGPRIRQRAASSINAQIAQNTANYQEYIINLSVGTPGQKLGVTLDTGSSDLWIPSSAFCKTKKCDFGSFNPNSSSTYRLEDEGGFKITYAAAGDSDAGDVVTDTVSVAGANSINQTFGLSYTGYDAHGVLGIGPSGQDSVPTVVDNMVQDGLINRRAYSLYLNAYHQQHGSLLFGGIDSTKYTGNLVALPLQPGFDGVVSGFYVTLSKVTFTDATGTDTLLTPDGYAQSMLLDSGTAYTTLTGDLLERLANGMGAVAVNSQGTLMVPCGYNNTNATINYTFGGSNGVTIAVPVAETIGGRSQNECSFGFSAATSLGGLSILGDTFLRSAYVVFDIDNKVAALAQAINGRASTSKVVVIPTGTSLPGISSTASATGTQLTGNALTASPTLITASTHRYSIMAGTPTFNLGAAATASVVASGGTTAHPSATTSSSNMAVMPAATGLVQAAIWGAGLVAGALVI